MKTLAILVLVAMEIAVCACGTSPNQNPITNTTSSGSWEAQLVGGTGQAAELNFVATFSVTNSGPLDITGFSFFNTSACFANGTGASNETGTASFTTNTTTDQVTGALTFTVNSVIPSGNVLTLTAPQGGLTGTSNGTITTTGTLSNGVAVGQWTLNGGAGDASCNNQFGTFIMCQAAATCTVP